MKDYRKFSLWLDDIGDTLTPRPPLPGDTEADVAIVGAGYTGLWTAFYLLESDPHLRVAMIEKEIAGYGASGRNGGWCSALFAASLDAMAREHGRDAAVGMQRALFDTVDEVGRVAEREHIDARFQKGGTITFVTAPSQMERVRGEVEEHAAWGFGDEDYRWLEPDEAAKRLRLSRNLGAAYTPHCARIHPARLVRGLADAVEKRGGKVFEQSPATAIEPRRVRTAAGSVRADVVVRATEGYTDGLTQARNLVPLYSLMIATEPLPQAFWDEVGWDERETLNDGRHLLIYGQRTSDNRIALGGRGAPYHFGSRIDDSFDREPRVFEELAHVLVDLFPAAGDVRITHRWGGSLGVPRDWYSSVGLDRATGLAWAGGYVGDGVAVSNLAGRTLSDLILQRDTDLVHLPWVDHHSKKWEPEPLRWLGINLGLRVTASADKAEARTHKPARRGDLVKLLMHH
ncbi:MAG TPA: FAD-binding oxidoreductase [Actinomycetota bacterium]|nr:FAD-binding oxidoreductase [Actinomycetota bacterium]